MDKFNTYDLTVIGLGLVTVFTGLIIIIFLCKLMSLISGTSGKVEETTRPVASVPVAPAPTVIPDKPAVIAAVSAVVAEELGTDISNIRIHSIKRV